MLYYIEYWAKLIIRLNVTYFIYIDWGEEYQKDMEKSIFSTYFVKLYKKPGDESLFKTDNKSSPGFFYEIL